MVRAFKGARQSYATYPEKKSKKKIQTKDEEKATHITPDIENLKDVSMMENEYMQCMELAEKKRNLTFVVKGNGLQRKCD